MKGNFTSGQIRVSRIEAGDQGLHIRLCGKKQVLGDEIVIGWISEWGADQITPPVF